MGVLFFFILFFFYSFAIQQQLYDLQPATLSGKHQGVPATPRDGINIGTSVQKKADSLQLTLTRSFNQGRLFTVIGDIDVGTIVQQKANNIKKSHPGSRHPSCAAKPPEDIDTGEKKGYPLFSVENLWVSYSVSYFSASGY